MLGKLLFIPIFFLSVFVLSSTALATHTTEEVLGPNLISNGDFSLLENRTNPANNVTNINVPVDFCMIQDFSFVSCLSDPTAFDQAVVPFQEFDFSNNNLKMIFNDTHLETSVSQIIPNSINFTIDNSKTFRFTFSLSENLTLINASNEGVFNGGVVNIQFFNSNGVPQDDFEVQINRTDVIFEAGVGDPNVTNFNFDGSTVTMVLSDFDTDHEQVNVFVYNFDDFGSPAFSGDITFDNFAFQELTIVPVEDPPSVTGTPAIIVQIIAVMVALGGIIGGGLLIAQSGRIDGTIIITGFVIALISIIFAVAIVGLV